VEADVRVVDLLLGRRLANSEQKARRIGAVEAVPAMGLDGLGSASYGPEAALAILMPLGGASLAWIVPVMAPVIALLLVLYLSYRQTVVAYKANGGAYTVSKQNLGRTASLLAASALMIDYVLNVAVGISAGIGALTSSIPALHPYTLALCLAVLALLAIANLRGTGEAGWLFALPTYLFLASFLGLIAAGLWRIAMSGGHPQPVIAPPALAPATETVSLWLLMRAFAAGCTAMTGVEAVSNAVGAFRPPVTRRAHQTLTVICLSLGLLLAGVAKLAGAYGVGAMDQARPGYQSVLSQLAGAVAGRGALYYVAMTSLLAVLSLSANTSFVGFPRLCRVLAEDSFLPRPFAFADRRLVFSGGIGFLALSAAALLIAFGGITDRLIPLFAIGAFLTFTLSQAGMAAHWRRQEGRNRLRLAINTAGALVTALALGIITVAKFLHGAWIVLAAIPAAVATLVMIRRYYDRLEESLRPTGPFELEETEPPTILVTVERRTRMTDHALSFAMTLSPDVIAIHLLHLDAPDTDEDIQRMKQRWTAEIVEPMARRGLKPPRLVVVPAPQRVGHRPLLEFIDKLDIETPGRSVAVLEPELVLGHWWERLLHARRGERLRTALLASGGPRLKLITVPWRRPARPRTPPSP
jgi:amino acid transporter